jgi:hypothetical protein
MSEKIVLFFVFCLLLAYVIAGGIYCYKITQIKVGDVYRCEYKGKNPFIKPIKYTIKITEIKNGYAKFNWKYDDKEYVFFDGSKSLYTIQDYYKKVGK